MFWRKQVELIEPFATIGTKVYLNWKDGVQLWENNFLSPFSKRTEYRICFLKSFNDPTITRLLSFSEKWNYGTLIVVNLFARISSSSCKIERFFDPIGKGNNEELAKWIYEWSNNPLSDLWLGWGNKGVLRNRNLEGMSLLRVSSIMRSSQYPCAAGPLILGLTYKGHPRHPLYMSNQETLKPLDLS